MVRNRIAIAIASLIWLVWRSGTQPRRLAYPCQQAAAANLGFLAVLFIPGLAKMKARQAATVRQRAMALATGSVCLAGLLFVLVSGGIAVYSEYVDDTPMAAPPPYEALGDPTTVAIVKEDPVTNIEQMVRDAIALAGGLEDLIDDNDTVVIKPNLVSHGNTPGSGICTRWEVVAAVVKVAKEAASNVTVKLVEGCAWSDGGNEGRVTMTAFNQYGYDNNWDGWFDDDTSVELVDLNNTGGWNNTSGATWVPVAGLIRSGYYVHNTLHNADVFISVPTFKNHYNASYTGALKNQIGSSPGDLYYNYDNPRQPLHRGLHYCDNGDGRVATNCTDTSGGENDKVGKSIVDLNLAKTIDFAVIDALVGIDDGPGGTSLPPTGAMKMIVAGRDALAVDTVCTVAMGYEQESIGHIEWAASTGALGTNNLDAISVVGDHVDAVRLSWWADYYGADQENDQTNPSIAGINITNGQTVSGNVSIVGSGISDSGPGTVGVIKSELYIDGVLVDTDTTNNSANFSWNSNTVSNGSHQIRIYVYDDALNEASITRNVTVDNNNNLLLNGDFSSGLNNWTEWSGWGNGTQTNDGGTLKLACTAGGSFGVYQQVAVTPGHTYMIDAYWKANKYGDLNNWYEIMLIDGSFSMYQADSGGAAVVTLNHMYAYDMSYSATCGSGGYPIPASFDWIWTHTQNNENVDNCWNDRDGQRTASGSTMTVVLKAGAFGGSAMAWFDGVSLVDTEGPTEVCDNGTDDDLDGDTDCCDTDCAGIHASCMTEVGFCSDGIDNDCDGATDGADGDCSGGTVILTETFPSGTADLGIGAPSGWQLESGGYPNREYFGRIGQIETDGSYGQPDPGSYDGNPSSGTLAVQVLCDWNDGGDPFMSNKQLQYVTFTTTPGGTYHVSAWVNTVKAKSFDDWNPPAYPDNPWKTGAQAGQPDEFADIQIGLKNGSDVNASDLDTVYTPVTGLLDNMSTPTPHDAWVQTQTQLLATGTQMSLILKLRSFDIASAADCDLDVRWDNITVTDLDGGTCAKPVLNGAVSRKTHIDAGDYDINVGIGAIESRSAQLGTAPNELTIIADFDRPVAVLGGADAVQTDIGTVTSVTPNADSDSSKVEISITDLTLNCQVNLSFADTGVGVVDASCPTDPAYASDSTLCVRVIVGDYDNLARTNFTDFSLVKNAGYINQLVDSLDKARADFDCSGRPNFTDFARVKNAGLINQTAPACPVPPIGP